MVSDCQLQWETKIAKSKNGTRSQWDEGKRKGRPDFVGVLNRRNYEPETLRRKPIPSCRRSGVSGDGNLSALAFAPFGLLDPAAWITSSWRQGGSDGVLSRKVVCPEISGGKDCKICCLGEMRVVGREENKKRTRSMGAEKMRRRHRLEILANHTQGPAILKGKRDTHTITSRTGSENGRW